MDFSTDRNNGGLMTKRHLFFVLSWSVLTTFLVVLPPFISKHGRTPSAFYPLDGASSQAVRYRYLVFPKIHHSQFKPVREAALRLYDRNSQESFRDTLIDFGSPVVVQLMPPAIAPCGELIARYKEHEASLRRAIANYWQRGGNQRCSEIIVTIVDEVSSPHLDFGSVRRETGRVLFLTEQGDGLAQMILWRDDHAKNSFAQVQPLDPKLDIGSGFSALPLDWPRLSAHRQRVRSARELRVPNDRYVKNILIDYGVSPWQCSSQLLGLKFVDSWGRNAHSQWCYGDSFPKMIENDHYYAYRVEE